MRASEILDKFRLLAMVLPLASCLVDERAEWANPDDPQGSAWRDHAVSIVAPGFYPVDSLVLEVGTRLELLQNYSIEPKEDPVGSWVFRDLGTGSRFTVAGTSSYGSIDTLLPRGSWMVRSEAHSPSGGVYLPDSMVLVVEDTGARPRLRLPADTILFRSLSQAQSGIPGFVSPLTTVDPAGRSTYYTFSVSRDGGDQGPQRWTPTIEFLDVDGFGKWHVRVEVMNTVGLSDTGSFDVTVRSNELAVGGETYRIGPFGSQVWMLENLRAVPSSSAGSWCYGDLAANCDTYGRLYDWATATAGQGRNMTSGSTPDFTTRIRGLCPEGWHLPTFEEAMDLKAWLKREGSIPGTSSKHLLPDELVGRALEARSGWDAFWPDTAWRGASGFDLLPGGYRDPDDGTFQHIGAHGAIWTTSHYGSDSARFIGAFENQFYRAIDTTDERSSIAGRMLQVDFDSRAGFSVRCLED